MLVPNLPVSFALVGSHLMNYPIENEFHGAEGRRILHLGASAAPQAQVVHHKHFSRIYSLERICYIEVQIECCKKDVRHVKM